MDSSEVFGSVGAKAENFGNVAREKWGDFQLEARSPKPITTVSENGPGSFKENDHLPSIDFQDPFGVSFRGGIYSNDCFFFDLQPKKNRTRFFPGQLVTRERHLIERANHYSACSLCVKFDHLPQARVENTQKTSDLSSKLT